MSSSETTQILFNSPALHSLKRDQLVKLCKIHSIKASGKNTELIQKLKNHAASLPHGSPLSVAARSEQPGDDGGSVSSRLDSQRPSEQWEVVMEDIPEEANALDEFGTGGGSKSESFVQHIHRIYLWPDHLFSFQHHFLTQGDSHLVQLQTSHI
jgi:hypothetical protein